MTQANKLLGAGQTAQAKAVMADGYAYFEKAPAAWPDMVAFTGPVLGWDQAKQLAQTCAKRFASTADLCRQAALSPQEVAQQKQRAEAKAESLVNKWTKKK